MTLGLGSGDDADPSRLETQPFINADFVAQTISKCPSFVDLGSPPGLEPGSKMPTTQVEEPAAPAASAPVESRTESMECLRRALCFSESPEKPTPEASMTQSATEAPAEPSAEAPAEPSAEAPAEPSAPAPAEPKEPQSQAVEPDSVLDYKAGLDNLLYMNLILSTFTLSNPSQMGLALNLYNPL